MHGKPVIGWSTSDNDWMVARWTGLGASEVASALGLEGAYETPWQVWARKTGRFTRDLDSEAAALGNDLEPWLRDRAERVVHGRVSRPAARLYRHPEHSWMLASPDAVVQYPGEQAADELAELKTCGIFTPYAAKDWTADEVPLRVEVQAVWQMAVMGIRTRCHIVGLIRDHGVVHHVIEWDPTTEQILIDRAQIWWHTYVVHDVEPDLAVGDDAVVAEIYADVTPGVAEIPAEVRAGYLSARAKAGDAAKGFEIAKAQMRRALAGRLTGEMNGILVATYKPNRKGVRQLWVAGER